MATAERTILVVAAEALEFDGILAQLGPGTKLNWPGIQFARQVTAKNARYWLAANGPGRACVSELLKTRREVSAIVSTGFCGALDPSLSVGDIVVSGAAPSAQINFRSGRIHSVDRVIIKSQEKLALRNETGALAVEMEAAAVEEKAREWGVPFYCIRVVSDTASDDMPLDFNHFRDAQGRFSRTRISMAAMARPLTAIPALLRLNKNCKCASQKLGVFFADCRF
jgi:adenosylhomocysteine nucleosidase